MLPANAGRLLVPHEVREDRHIWKSGRATNFPSLKSPSCASGSAMPSFITALTFSESPNKCTSPRLKANTISPVPPKPGNQRMSIPVVLSRTLHNLPRFFSLPGATSTGRRSGLQFLTASFRMQTRSGCPDVADTRQVAEVIFDDVARPLLTADQGAEPWKRLKPSGLAFR